ncbi:BON domain-containing protein [Actinoplanes sp. TRM 88003]|uniref:BON domain-containing protein n=1 Tax=Paractinoplanes aksuensis TaxID=2939490 RepID=A0ABT1E4J8_9ACTN|nr:BON domain-containing protein [Actinoplanes aksuensis]MCO8278064.1 BON domain-containing protein [Actinoplanes aksuensis]
MQTRTDDATTRETAPDGALTHPADFGIAREVGEVLRRRLWFSPGQVQVRVNRGTAVLTGAVGRQSTAGIAARLAAAVPGISDVDDQIRYEFDDSRLVRSRVGRTHPFSAEPFRPGRSRRRRRAR